MDEHIHEVSFYDWCPKCQHYLKKGDEEPCDSCLDQPWNTDSRKPVNFKEK